MKFTICVVLTIVSGVIARSSKDLTNESLNEEEAKAVKELEAIVKDLEIVEKLESQIDSDQLSRDSRGLLKKLSFLAGLKAGGLIQSSGTLAASNSLRIFGKVMNTALSVSYGTVDNINEIPGIDERPVVEGDEGHNTKSDATVVNVSTSPEAALQSVRQNFIKNHNNFVERINHKFLRTGGTPRSS